jgi:Uma2 family endonuclease
MVETETKKKITLEEFLKLPYERIQLIDGDVVNEPAPNYEHQKVLSNIHAQISFQLRDNILGDLVVAPVDVLFGKNVLQPDMLFILKDRLDIVADGKVTAAPDVAFEIISESNSFNDTKIKFDIYQQFGVKEYFIIYPEDKTVVKYVLVEGKYHEQYREIGVVKSEIIGCNINF